MTPDSRILDEAILFASQPLTVYRLARTVYVSLSGAGSAARAGRWNQFGEEAIYTSLEIGTTVLERLVHTRKDLIPSNLSLMSITISGNWTEHGSYYRQDNLTGGVVGIFNSLRDANRFAQQSDPLLPMPFAIAVPSVIVPVWNVVLYPRRHGFESHVKLGSDEPLVLDPRLFPDGVSREA